MDDGALVGDVENCRNPADAHAVRNDASELDDLGVLELASHPIEQPRVHVAVLERESLGELDGQLLASRELVTLVVSVDVRVFVLSEPSLRIRRSPSIESYIALVDLGQPHPRRLDLTNGQSAVGVHGFPKGAYGVVHRRDHLPHPYSFGLVARWYVYVSHAFPPYQISGSTVPESGSRELSHLPRAPKGPATETKRT
ncbi:MAG: hypothetical protein OXI18_06205 [bacterium]|nr:hypothetical protein [bacterium]